jgi:hypothetical protein
MIQIFLCYRRDESAEITGRIYERLADRFGGDAVFMDGGTWRHPGGLAGTGIFHLHYFCELVFSRAWLR